MPTSYNTASGHQASYYVSPAGNVMVNIQNSSPLKFRAAYVGNARMKFMWVSSGKSTHWQFTPTIDNPTQAQYSQDPENLNLNVELGNKLIPAAGIIKPNASGEIIAPAIHFDIPYATDLWIFLIRSTWFPLKITVDKPQLNISHDSANATADLQTGPNGFDEKQDILNAYVSTFGQGFKKVELNLKRNVGNTTLDQKLGEIANGTETFTWKPTISSFDTVLVANSTMYVNQFVDFLKSLGAQTHSGFFSGTYLQDTFFLGDGPTINYTLQLTGERGFLSHSKDETKITLTP